MIRRSRTQRFCGGRASFALTAAIAFGACRPEPFPPDVVARYDGGSVALAEVQERLALESRTQPSPPSERAPAPRQTGTGRHPDHRRTDLVRALDARAPRGAAREDQPGDREVPAAPARSAHPAGRPPAPRSRRGCPSRVASKASGPLPGAGSVERLQQPRPPSRPDEEAERPAARAVPPGGRPLDGGRPVCG